MINALPKRALVGTRGYFPTSKLKSFPLVPGKMGRCEYRRAVLYAAPTNEEKRGE